MASRSGSAALDLPISSSIRSSRHRSPKHPAGISQISSKEGVVRIRFGLFTLDDRTRQLLKGERPVALSPKALELLLTLASRQPEVLSKAELQERLWPKTFVSEANLSNLVAEVRAALGDRPRAPRFIRTAHGFGYAFCGDVVDVDDKPTTPTRPACWLEWGRRRFPL